MIVDIGCTLPRFCTQGRAMGNLFQTLVGNKHIESPRYFAAISPQGIPTCLFDLVTYILCEQLCPGQMADAFTLIILYGDVTSIECLGSSEDDPDMFNVFSRDVQYYKRHYSGVTWALLHLKSPAMWLFVQQFVANIKENIRAQWCR